MSRRLRACVALTALAILGPIGCSAARPHGPIARSEPPLAPPGTEPGGTAVVEAPPAKEITFVDRHPLFSRPRDYYESSGDRRIVKMGAATFLGIPAGIVGEMRQIVAGRPAPAY